jgi:hypothetical protein
MTQLLFNGPSRQGLRAAAYNLWRMRAVADRFAGPSRTTIPSPRCLHDPEML